MADVQKHKDSTDRADSQPSGTLDHVDRTKLLADKGTPTHTGATTEKDLPPQGHLNDELKKADIYAKDAPKDAPKPLVEEIKSDKPVDPKQPTVAFLDDFQKGYIPLNGKQPNGQPEGLSHGELSAKAAEQNGFNVVRLQSNDRQTYDGLHQDFSRSLNEVVKKIDSGELKLGKGDVLNMSLGNNEKRDVDGRKIPGSGDPNFSTLSLETGLNITPENIASQKSEVINKLREFSQNPEMPDSFRKEAAVAVATNEAINELQKRGVKVVVAGGNDGPQNVSADFLNATQLSNQRPDGTMDPTSADSSVTTPEKTPREIKYSGANVFDPTPVAEQKGVYSAQEPTQAPDGTVTNKTVATFPDSEFGGMRTDPTSFYLRKDGKYQAWQDPSPQFADESRKQSAYGKDLHKVPKFTPSADLEHFAPTSPDAPYQHFQPLKKGEHLGGHIINLRPSAQSEADKELSLQRKIGAGKIVGLVNGTSFSNIEYLSKIKADLIREKNGQ